MVRDLEKLRTRSEFRLRTGHLALIVAASAIGAGVLFAVGTALAGQTTTGEETAAAEDPFAALEQNAAREAPRTAATTAETDTLGKVDLRFHDRLIGGDTAGVLSTSAETDSFEEPLDADPPAPEPVAAPAPRAPRPPEATDDAPLAATAPALPAAPSPANPVLPLNPPAYAGVPVAPVPLQAVRQPAAPPIPEPGPTTPAFDEEPVPPIAEPGSKGVFTLQVSTFEDQDEAVAFMNMLRLRGHESFLVRAHGPDRGFLYRVRVGPFASQPEAERYRRRFERTERIPTFVVRRRLPGEE